MVCCTSIPNLNATDSKIQHQKTLVIRTFSIANSPMCDYFKFSIQHNLSQFKKSGFHLLGISLNLIGITFLSEIENNHFYQLSNIKITNYQSLPFICNNGKMPKKPMNMYKEIF